MNKIVRRIFAGVSAVILSVSAIGSDTWIGNFMQTLHADSDETVLKQGSQDNFLNPEQDTRTDDSGNKIYNTNYGLHTDKTVSKAYIDGRTFDLDLESWYVGANPADIGFVLDASGSMAWSTTSLDPLYVKNWEDIGKNKILSDEELAEILHTDYTNNDPVSYKDYHYYIYDPRDTVNEFVPIGYWDANKVIGYYSFDNTLENELGGSAKMIAHADAGGTFTEDPCIETTKIQFKNGGLDLSETDKKGNVIIDLSNQLSVENDITISFTLNCDQLGGTGMQYVPQSPILYLGDKSNTDYIALMRGRAHSGTGASNHIYLYDSNTHKLETYDSDGNRLQKVDSKTGKSSDTEDNKFIDKYGEDIKCTLKISVDTENSNRYKIELSSETNAFIYYTENLNKLKSDNLYLVLGGNEILPQGDLVYNGTNIDPTNLSGNYIKDLNITGTTTEGKEFTSSFSLKNNSGLTASENPDIKAGYYKQVEGETAFDTVNPPASSGKIVDPVYETTTFKIKDKNNKDQDVECTYLNVTKTSEAGGGILLDTTPLDPNNFSISFKITNALKTGGKSDSTDGNAEIMYIGNMEQSGNYYKLLRSGTNGLGNTQTHIRFCENGDSVKASGNKAFGTGKWENVTLTVENGNVTVYVNGEISSDPPGSASGVGLLSGDIRLIIAGLADTYAGNDIWIDDLYIYDEVLTAKQAKTIYNFSLSSKDKLYNQNLNVAYDEKGEVYAQLQNGTALGKNFPGWYYINGASGWDRYEANGTGKQLIGLIHDEGWTEYSSKTIYNASIPSAYSVGGSEEDYTEFNNKFKINAGQANEDASNANLFVEPEKDEDTTPIRFFVDSDGYLRCFAQNGGESKKGVEKRTFCSYVYERDPDDQEIKSETLENALTEFVTKLGENSEVSRVSATRFSTREAPVSSGESEKLVAHQWEKADDFTGEEVFVKTNDKDGFVDTEKNKNSYVYNLTGGTATWTGLKSFYENLEKDNTSGNSKYLVIFTDGRDTFNNNDTTGSDNGGSSANSDDFPTDHIGNLKNELAGKWANFLKEEGYTIYCVMLASGSVSPTANLNEYETTCKFLASLAGNDKVTVSYDDKDLFNQYVYPVVADVELGEGEEPPLNRAFNTILEKIMQDITGYTIQDYIDPRFDLITYQNKPEGEVLKLGASGNVTLAGRTPEDITSGGYEYKTKDGKIAKIYYDSEKYMYYLRWTNQSIPSITKPVNSEKDGTFISVWDSTITLKAKDDFIGGNAILTNGNEAGMNLVYNPSNIEADKNEKDQLKSLSGTNNSNGGAGKSPSKGFPKVVTCVRLLNITTKPLNEVIYLGEVVSPTYMLSELEDGYMEGSYYLEYLKRYAYRLYPDGTETPLLELLNQWLKIDESGEKDKTFTIPYIYLPDPQYNNDGTLEKDTSDEVVVNNNSGTPGLNQKDIVGFLTYTWKRVDPDTGEPYTGSDDIMLEFVAKDTKPIKYNLELKFTPLQETKNIEIDEHFIDNDSCFKVDDGNFVNIDKSSTEKWKSDTRENYLKALISDKSHGTESSDVYEWKSDYKPTKGTLQVEKDRKYGDAEVKEGSLIASTTYTKDVVNAGLALEMIVKGSDLKESDIGTTRKEFTFTAKRNYTDALDPVYYKKGVDGNPPSMGANASNEEYKLTFTIQDVLSNIDSDSTYTIWAELTKIEKGEEELKNGLPIGTYTITANLETDEQFTVNGSNHFKNFNADNNRGNFIYTRFPENVYQTSSNAAKDTGDEKYLIWDETRNLDFAKENIAENKKNIDTNSLTFYFGTVDKKTVNGEEVTNAKGDSVKDIPDTTNNYAKDRLGIIMLSYGSNRLAISKEVTSKNIAVIKEQAVLNNFWNFDITLTLNEGAESMDTKSYSLKCLYLDTGKEITEETDKPKVGNDHVTELTFKEDPADSKIYKATISIKSNTQVILEQLPENVSYEVSEVRSEQKEDGDFQDRYRYDILVEGENPDIDINQEYGKSSGELSPASSVNFINQFPSPELPSAGGAGIDITLYCGIMLVVAAGLYFTTLFCKKCRTHDEREE